MNDEEIDILRRKADALQTAELQGMKTAIAALTESMVSLRSDFHGQMGAISIQIAKLPAPMTLEQMEHRFVLRKESEKEERLIKYLIDTFITKEEIRPLKVGIYGLWFAIAAAVITTLIKLAL